MKNPLISFTNGQHSRDMASGTCTSCRGPAKSFKDSLSLHEHGISGLCQKCQDEVFGGNDDN